MTSFQNPRRNARPDQDPVEQRPSCVRYAVRGAAEPRLLSRVFASLSRRGVTPRSARASLSANGRELVIDVRLAEIDQEVAARILRCLPRVQGVDSVEMSEGASPATQLVDQFLEDQIAHVEAEIARRLADYEFLVSMGQIRRDLAVRDYVRITSLRDALRKLRADGAP